jgi:hypothetical protein
MPRPLAVVGMLLTLAPLACTTVVRPGLANAPALSGTPVDARVHDAIANGGDSCERRLGSGPLRNEIPPCASEGRPAGDPPIAIQPPSTRGIVVPWVQHYYINWPCSSWDNQVTRMTLARGLASPTVGFNGVLNGAGCGTPLE